MAVPITIFYKINPNQFEVVDTEKEFRGFCDGKELFVKTLVKLKS